MKAAIIGMMLIGLVGCQSVQNSWHMEVDVIKNTKIKRNPGMITSPYTEVLHQECPTSARIDATMYEGYDKLKFSECVTMKREINGVMSDHWDQAFEPGTLNGVGGAVLNAAAIGAAGHMIGKGLRGSGGVQNNTNTNNAAFYDGIPPKGGHALVK
jgi:hypothetical protein